MLTNFSESIAIVKLKKKSIPVQACPIEWNSVIEIYVNSFIIDRDQDVSGISMQQDA
jgi:hypothetical protein